MEISTLFPIEFFSFKNQEIDNQDILSKLKKYTDRMKHGDISSSLHTLHNKTEFHELFLWINNCIEEIRINQHYDCDRFEISNSWFNITPADSYSGIHYHRHSMSFFSGIYYLTKGAPTVFEDPVMQRAQAQLEVLRLNYSPLEQIFPEPGKLVIFPSWVYHYALPHVENFDRYVISFNVLPTGAINYNIATDSVAYIEIKNREKFI